MMENGAGSRVRTRDPLITNQVLYQLSYTGARCHLASKGLMGNGVDWKRHVVSVIASGSDAKMAGYP